MLCSHRRHHASPRARRSFLPPSARLPSSSRPHSAAAYRATAFAAAVHARLYRRPPRPPVSWHPHFPHRCGVQHRYSGRSQTSLVAAVVCGCFYLLKYWAHVGLYELHPNSGCLNPKKLALAAQQRSSCPC